MSLRINNNIAALNGHRNMVRNDAAVSKSLERLSSGMRINRAADDAAGLIISEQMRAQLTGLSQAVMNSEQAVTLVQTAEGALDEMSNLLNKARSLAIHAANDGLNDTNQLQADQSELDNIVDSMGRIASDTQFGTKKLLDGTLSNAKINDKTLASAFSASGLNTNTLTVSITASGVRATPSAPSTMANANVAAIFNTITTGASVDLNATFKAATTFSFSSNAATTVAPVNVTVAAGSTMASALSALNNASSANGVSVSIGAGGVFTIAAADIGTYANGMTFSITGSGSTNTYSAMGAGVTGTNAVADLYYDTTPAATVAISGLTSSRGTSLSAYTAASGGSPAKSATVVFNEARLTAGAAFSYASALAVSGGATFQVGANANQTAQVSLKSMTTNVLGLNSKIASGATTTSMETLKTGQFLLNGKAQDAIMVIDKAIDDVTTARGALGAFQSNTLETAINSLRATQENLTHAESTIRDVDFAAESAQFTKNNILVQSSTAMLAQANQLPQNVLKLLQ